MSDEVKKYLTDILESVLTIEEYLGDKETSTLIIIRDSFAMRLKDDWKL